LSIGISDTGLWFQSAFGLRNRRAGEDVGVAGADYSSASTISAEKAGADLLARTTLFKPSDDTTA
jgi:hypothetical protein